MISSPLVYTQGRVWHPEYADQFEQGVVCVVSVIRYPKMRSQLATCETGCGRVVMGAELVLSRVGYVDCPGCNLFIENLPIVPPSTETGEAMHDSSKRFSLLEMK